MLRTTVGERGIVGRDRPQARVRGAMFACVLAVVAMFCHVGPAGVVRCIAPAGPPPAVPMDGAKTFGMMLRIASSFVVTRVSGHCSEGGAVRVEACPVRQAIPPLLVLLLLSVFPAGGFLLPAPVPPYWWAPGAPTRLSLRGLRQRRALLQVFRN